MCPATLGSLDRAPDHQPGRQQHALHLPAIGVVEGLVEAVPAPEVDHLQRVPQLAALPLDADVPPHRTSQTGPDIDEVEFAGASLRRLGNQTRTSSGIVARRSAAARPGHR